MYLHLHGLLDIFYHRNLQFLNLVIISKAKVLLHEACVHWLILPILFRPVGFLSP